jgi:hypothetical protein
MTNYTYIRLLKHALKQAIRLSYDLIFYLCTRSKFNYFQASIFDFPALIVYSLRVMFAIRLT